MFRKHLICFLISFFVGGALVLAQEDDLQSSVDYKVNKMQKVLALTDSQAIAIKPIIKNYVSKRMAFMQETQGQGIVDHVAVKATLKQLRDNEYQQLGKVLSQDQLKKWINKETLTAALNPDSGQALVDDGPVLTTEGANFKF